MVDPLGPGVVNLHDRTVAPAAPLTSTLTVTGRLRGNDTFSSDRKASLSPTQVILWVIAWAGPLVRVSVTA